jgi:hypothetical protein
MTQLSGAIGALVEPVASAFIDGQADFWRACHQQDPMTRATVATGLFKTDVEAAFIYLDQNSLAAPLLADLLLARPGAAALRNACAIAYPPALDAVPEPRFRLETLIAQVLSGADAARLRDSVSRIDALTGAVAAYKGMHDSLHVLQPCLSLMRKAAAEPARWGDLTVYGQIFRQQLVIIDGAIAKLDASGLARTVSFRAAIDHDLALLESAVTSGEAYDIADATSQLASDIKEGLSEVDTSMRNTAGDALWPLKVALGMFMPLAATAAGTSLETLIGSFIDFAHQVSGEMQDALTEHGRWQLLDRQFDLLQRIVVEEQAALPGDIEQTWRMTSRSLSELCSGVPVPDWATAIVDLIALTAADLKPPLTPPLAQAARDRVSSLIASGRSRFMTVDQSLLSWLETSRANRPKLLILLQSPGAGNHG